LCSDLYSKCVINAAAVQMLRMVITQFSLFGCI